MLAWKRVEAGDLTYESQASARMAGEWVGEWNEVEKKDIGTLV